jgi:hypothetical protein
MAELKVCWLTQAMMVSLPTHSGALGFDLKFCSGLFRQPADKLIQDFLVSGIVR